MLCCFTYGCGLTMNLFTNCLILDLKKYLQLCYGFATPVILNFMCQKPKTLKILILVRFQIYVHVEIYILEHASVM
jgi:hypothetical protein